MSGKGSEAALRVGGRCTSGDRRGAGNRANRGEGYDRSIRYLADIGLDSSERPRSHRRPGDVVATASGFTDAH